MLVDVSLAEAADIVGETLSVIVALSMPACVAVSLALTVALAVSDPVADAVEDRRRDRVEVTDAVCEADAVPLPVPLALPIAMGVSGTMHARTRLTCRRLASISSKNAVAENVTVRGPLLIGRRTV